MSDATSPHPDWPPRFTRVGSAEPSSEEVVAELDHIKDRIEDLIERLTAFAEGRKP